MTLTSFGPAFPSLASTKAGTAVPGSVPYSSLLAGSMLCVDWRTFGGVVAESGRCCVQIGALLSSTRGLQVAGVPPAAVPKAGARSAGSAVPGGEQHESGLPDLAEGGSDVDGRAPDAPGGGAVQRGTARGGVLCDVAGGSAQYFDGKIDEVAIWNDELTSAEVTAIYNSGNMLNVSSDSGNYASAANLKGYYRFNEGSGTSLQDNSSNSNTGTITGATWAAGFVSK